QLFSFLEVPKKYGIMARALHLSPQQVIQAIERLGSKERATDARGWIAAVQAVQEEQQAAIAAACSAIQQAAVDNPGAALAGLQTVLTQATKLLVMLTGAMQLEADYGEIVLEVLGRLQKRNRKPLPKTIRQSNEIIDLRDSDPKFWSLKKLARKYKYKH